MNIEPKAAISSKEAKKELKISDCDLMHLRVEGKIRFEKKGNAFFYDKRDIELIFQKSKKK
jgi:hypothetical protein